MHKVRKFSAIIMAAIMTILSTNIVSAGSASNITGVPPGDYAYICEKMREGLDLINSIDSIEDYNKIIDSDYGLLRVNAVNPLAAMAYNSNNIYTKNFCIYAGQALLECGACESAIAYKFSEYFEANFPELLDMEMAVLFTSDYYRQNMAVLYNTYQELFTYTGSVKGFGDLVSYKRKKLNAKYDVEYISSLYEPYA